jgi:predicted transcriptional regulator of viral defense system
MIGEFPSLSPRELALLSELDRKHRRQVTSEEASQLLGAAAHRVLSDMARKGLLNRVSRGVYVVRPLRSIARPWTVSALAAVEHLLSDEPHYIGGLIALTLHRLTDQVHASVIDAYIVRRRRERTIANAAVHFHLTEPRRIDVGLTRVPVEHVAVAVSDPEKTLLDALDHPKPFGGLREAVRLVDRSLDRIDADILVQYALQLSPLSTLQRLGVLLERRGAAPAKLSDIANRVRDSSNTPAMVPGPRTGRVHPTWHIIENDISSDAHSTPRTTKS